MKNKIKNNKFQLFEKVILLNDEYVEENLPKGSIGTVLEIYDDKNYEVEFCNQDGSSILFQSFNEKELDSYKK